MAGKSTAIKPVSRVEAVRQDGVLSIPIVGNRPESTATPKTPRTV